MKQPIRSISVVVPSRNAEATLALQLQALLDQDAPLPVEILAVNHRSSDQTAQVIESFVAKDPRVRHIRLETGAGVSASRNAGIAQAKGDLILICDSDDIVQEGWLAAMAAAAADADLVGGHLDFEPLNDMVTRRFERSPTENGLPHGRRIFGFAVGASMGIRREVIDAIGFFDDEYVRGGDEIEFCWRAQLAGFTLAYAPEARVSYRLRRDLRGIAWQSFYRGVAQVRLYRDFAAHGMQRRPVVRALYAWLRLLLRVGELRRPDRKRWVVLVATNAGRVWGSIKLRVLYL
jgi:GT2 family glycosyltransferase